MTRIYTRTGDAGETGLLGGRRVSKDDVRVEAYGTLDELNSVLGVARAFLSNEKQKLEGVEALLEELQHDLFALGAEVASPAGGQNVPRCAPEDVQRLERHIDRLDAALPPLREFILPGGAVTGSLIHLARTVSRRAERRLVALAKTETLNPELLRYLNRLSDLLFVLARSVNARLSATETAWQKADGGKRA
jgi:cob(I)alamin adenosyltransferase